MADGRRIASLDEIRQREYDLIHEDTLLKYGIGSTPTADTKRQLRTVYRMVECISHGFAPLVWDGAARGWLFSRRAMCIDCGHVVATNQPSWMRKHNATHHPTKLQVPPSWVDLLHGEA